MTAPLTIEETAERVAGYWFLAERAFAVLGATVTDIADPAAKVTLAAHARAHAWYVELWDEQLPAGFPHAVAAAAARFGPVTETLATLDPIERIVAFYRVVLPRSITAQLGHAARCSAAADGALARVLRIIRHDELDQWQEGEALVQVLLAGPEAISEAARAVARVESLWPVS